MWKIQHRVSDHIDSQQQVLRKGMEDEARQEEALEGSERTEKWERVKVPALASAFDKECFDGGRSSDCAGNLYGSEARDAVKAAYDGNAGDGRYVCSCILLNKQDNRQDKRDLPYTILRRKDLFILMHFMNAPGSMRYYELMSAGATACLAAAVSSFEGMTTAAAGHSIGIIDGKASTHQAVDIVNFAAGDVPQAHFINQYIEFTLGDESVTFLLFVKGHTVLET